MPNESCQCGHLDLSHVLENGRCSTLVGMSRLWCACTGFKAAPKPLGNPNFGHPTMEERVRDSQARADAAVAELRAFILKNTRSRHHGVLRGRS